MGIFDKLKKLFKKEEEVLEEDIIEKKISEPELEPEPEEGPESELPSGVPPIPDDGLPEGWTVDQWIHYGQRWLDQQNRD